MRSVRRGQSQLVSAICARVAKIAPRLVPKTSLHSTTAVSPFWTCPQAVAPCVVTALTFMLFHYASVRLKSAQVMAYSYLVPVMVMLMAVVAGQPLVLSILPAVGIILAVVVVMLKSSDDAITAPDEALPNAG